MHSSAAAPSGAELLVKSASRTPEVDPVRIHVMGCFPERSRPSAWLARSFLAEVNDKSRLAAHFQPGVDEGAI